MDSHLNPVTVQTLSCSLPVVKVSKACCRFGFQTVTVVLFFKAQAHTEFSLGVNLNTYSADLVQQIHVAMQQP